MASLILKGDKRKGYLQWLANKYGDFKISTKFKNGWTRHRTVIDCSHDINLQRFLKEANNRSILSCEIVLDFDMKIDETPEQLKQRFGAAIRLLKEEGYSFQAFHSGSKGYHIHLIFSDFWLYSEFRRKKFRESFIKRFDCDMLKSSERTMIALEYTPHYKTGQPKRLLISYRCEVYDP